MLLHNWPRLSETSLVDVSDLAEWQRKDQGAYYSQSEAAAKVGSRWVALPHSIVGVQMAYRKSWFDEVGQTTWPRTLEELRLVGLKLKKNGHPIGQTLAHTFGDAPTWAYPMLWNFGAAETDVTGRSVLDRKETVDSVRFMQAYWKDACDEGALAWDDTNNNRAPSSLPPSGGRTSSRTRRASPFGRTSSTARSPTGPRAAGRTTSRSRTGS